MTKKLIAILSLLSFQIAQASPSEFDVALKDAVVGGVIKLAKEIHSSEIFSQASLSIDLQQASGCMIPPRYINYLIIFERQKSAVHAEGEQFTVTIPKKSFQIQQKIGKGIYQVTLKDQLHNKILSQKSFTVHDTQHLLTMPLPCGKT